MENHPIMASRLAFGTLPGNNAQVASAETAEHQKPTTKYQNMKNLIVIIAAILAVGISGCAHKTAPAQACTDGKSCCAKGAHKH